MSGAGRATSCGCGAQICICSLPRVVGAPASAVTKRPLEGMAPPAPLARLDNLMQAPLARAPSLSQRLLARTASSGGAAAGGSDGLPLPLPPLPPSKLARQDGGPRPTTFLDVATRRPVLSDAEQAAQATMRAVRAFSTRAARLRRQRCCGSACRLPFQYGAHRSLAPAAARAGAADHAVSHPRRHFPPRRAAALARRERPRRRRCPRSRRSVCTRARHSRARRHASDLGRAPLGLVPQNGGALHFKHPLRLGHGAARGALRCWPRSFPRRRTALRAGGAPRARTAHLVSPTPHRARMIRLRRC
jgi:hypothetical protein